MRNAAALAEIAGAAFGSSWNRLTENRCCDLVSQPLHVFGDALESVVMQADSLGEAIANLITTAVLFDIGAVLLALAFFLSGVRPLFVQSRDSPRFPRCFRAALEGDQLDRATHCRH